MYLSLESDYFDSLYRSTVKNTLKHGEHLVVREQGTTELLNVRLTLTNVANCKIDFTKTKVAYRQPIYEKYLRNEIKWYESGSLKASDSPSPKVWNEFADTSGNIQSNYGHLILKKKNDYSSTPTSPYTHVIKILKADLHSRQAILHYNQPDHYKNAKDIPCTVCAQVLIRDKRLHFSVFQRSCDLFTGLIYDVPWHCHLIQKMTNELKITYSELEPGSLTLSIGSTHIYDSKLQFFKDFLEQEYIQSA